MLLQFGQIDVATSLDIEPAELLGCEVEIAGHVAEARVTVGAAKIFKRQHSFGDCEIPLHATQRQRAFEAGLAGEIAQPGFERNLFGAGCPELAQFAERPIELR